MEMRRLGDGCGSTIPPPPPVPPVPFLPPIIAPVVFLQPPMPFLQPIPPYPLGPVIPPQETQQNNTYLGQQQYNYHDHSFSTCLSEPRPRKFPRYTSSRFPRYTSPRFPRYKSPRFPRYTSPRRFPRYTSPRMQHASNQNHTSHRSMMPQPQKKFKRSQRCSQSESFSSKPWNRDDALQAINEEITHFRDVQKETLVIRFPDQEINTDIVKSFSDNIERVHFHAPVNARSCSVELRKGTDAEDIIQHLQKLEINGSRMQVEKKMMAPKIAPEEIDPYTLYVEYLPIQADKQYVKEMFPNATSIYTGLAERLQLKRFAFITFSNVKDSIEAYRRSCNLFIELRKIVVKFRRLRSSISQPEEKESSKVKQTNSKEKTHGSSPLDREKIIRRIKYLENEIERVQREEETDEFQKDDRNENNNVDEEDNTVDVGSNIQQQRRLWVSKKVLQDLEFSFFT